jgi:hypothetical protein
MSPGTKFQLVYIAVLFVIVVLLLSIGLPEGVHAQSSTTGNITGTVRDPQGAAVPKAEVTIINQKTGVARTVTTTDDGYYNANRLPAGVYSISASPAGFKKTITSGVELRVNENKTVNLVLHRKPTRRSTVSLIGAIAPSVTSRTHLTCQSDT